MKNTWLPLALALALAACNSAPKADATEAGSETAAAGEAGFYGKKIDEANAVSPDDMVKQLEGKDSVFVKVKAPVEATCQKKGCWMNVKLADGQEMRVRFKDYAFFVPTDTMLTKGKTAIFEGYAFRETVPVADLRHYAEDAGKSKEEIEAINKPEEQFTFMADGVILKN